MSHRRLSCFGKLPFGAAVLLASAALADVVLLDEDWTPEIRQNNVKVTPMDAKAVGDATLAKSGAKSVLLENANDGWPNVRFRNAGSVKLGDINLGADQVKLWYRTDAWDGTWQAQVWVYFQAAGKPVKVLEGMLDGGGEGGKLIADNQWHQATATLQSAGDFDTAPQDAALPVFFWLAPKSGWGKAHKTYIDRVELVSGKPAAPRPPPRPMAKVARKPGAQTNGPTWIWWEAEDAVAHTFQGSNAFEPANADQQDKLSNNDWLQHHEGAGKTGKWEVNVAEGGKLAFWTRKFWKHGPFKWRWNGGAWRECGRDIALADNVTLRLHLCANWVYLGEVELPAGKNTLEIEGLPDAAAIAFDCFLLSKTPFLPDGANKPGKKYNRTEDGWFAFEPDADRFGSDALLDLRSLNQKRAGDDGFVQARGMDFVFEKTGKPVQFWAVNTGGEFDDPSAVRYLARRLAKLGVNMIRIHGRVFEPKAPNL
ncbi:MAG: hypothetical protein FJ272_19355, partial [Planctomycetes bacterium]|nr:hypothetical protein [Planctomycetota bacterium]